MAGRGAPGPRHHRAPLLLWLRFEQRADYGRVGWAAGGAAGRRWPDGCSGAAAPPVRRWLLWLTIGALLLFEAGAIVTTGDGKLLLPPGVLTGALLFWFFVTAAVVKRRFIRTGRDPGRNPVPRRPERLCCVPLLVAAGLCGYAAPAAGQAPLIAMAGGGATGPRRPRLLRPEAGRAGRRELARAVSTATGNTLLTQSVAARGSRCSSCAGVHVDRLPTTRSVAARGSGCSRGRDATSRHGGSRRPAHSSTSGSSR